MAHRVGWAPLPDGPAGGATPSGGSVSNAVQVVTGMAGGLRRCYNLGLQADPGMKGSVRVTAKIDATGAVASAQASGSSGLSPVVVSCVVARVSQAMFAPPQAGGATVVIPVTFMSP